jgi:HEAT repeat protein
VAIAAPLAPRSLRSQFGIEQLSERTKAASLAERQRAYQRLAALGTPQSLQQLNAAVLRVLPRAKQNTAELVSLVEALAPHAGDSETQISLLRIVLGSVGPQGEPVEPELRQMAALAIAARRDAAAVRTLRRALSADTESARFAHEALLAHPTHPPAGQQVAPLPAVSKASQAAPSKPNAGAKTSPIGDARTAVTRARVAREMARLSTSQLLARLSTAPELAGLAACQLAARDEPLQRSTVKSLLGGTNPGVRLRVALGLGASPTADATGLLLQAYRDPVWQVRWAVLHALGQRRDGPSLRTLHRAATLEPKSEVRELARSLLAADTIAVRSTCPPELPLAALNEVDQESVVAAPNDLPEAAPVSKDRSNPHP